MSTHAVGSHHATPARAGFVDLLTSFLIRVERMMVTRRERRALLAASDDMLRDLGLSRADVYREGTRSFWDVPSR
jgi:uncharacterized protein YjiS (DUF1127 family)